MPTRYTFEQVKNTFMQNKCTLLDETYTNQLGKLRYIASCGHKNTQKLYVLLQIKIQNGVTNIYLIVNLNYYS